MLKSQRKARSKIEDKLTQLFCRQSLHQHPRQLLYLIEL